MKYMYTYSLWVIAMERGGGGGKIGVDYHVINMGPCEDNESQKSYCCHIDTVATL